MRALLLAAIASIGLVGCVGELDDGQMGGGGGSGVGSGTNPNPNPNSMAKKMFEDNVYPIIHQPGASATSNCDGCHSVAGATNPTAFVATDLADAYATATSFGSVTGNFTPTTAGILTKIDGGHNGRSYSSDERAKIVAWLAQEVIDRSSGNIGSGSGSAAETPGAATARLLNQWSACMTDANFKTAKMASQWGQMLTNNGSKCESCHATGGNGNFIASEVDTTFFTVVSTNRIYLSQYFTVDLSMGVPSAKIIMNDLVFQGVSNAQPPHTEHPRFTWANSRGYNATKSFYDLTVAGLGACDAANTQLNPPAQ